MFQLRRVIFSGVLLAVFLVQHASADLLPTSSWAGGEKWQGSSFYSADETYEFIKFDVRVDYAVYQTKEFNPDSGELEDRVLSGDELDFVDAFKDQSVEDYTYIYAYQILTRNQNTISVGNFSLLDGDDNLMDTSRFGDAGAIEDGDFGEGGIAPIDDELLNGIGIWEFDDLAFKKGENSWYLVYGSNESPVVGDFEVTDYQGGPIAPLSEQLEQATPTPEPVSILLLGSGFLAVRRRRKSVKV